MNAATEGSAGRTAPLLVLRPSRGWSALRLGEVWRARDLLASLAERDVKLRYRQTALGVSWVVLQPLITAGVLAFAFGRVVRLDETTGVPFLLFVFVGMLGWNAFQLSFVRMTGSLVGHAELVGKVWFPRLVLPLSTLASALVDAVVSLAVLALLLLLYGVAPPVQVLLVPLWLVPVLLLASGLGLLASGLVVRYRDVGLIVPVLAQFSLFASPVLFAMATVPESLRGAFWLNPLSAALEALRWSVLDGPLPPPGWLVWSCLSSLTIALAGAYVFKRLERGFADVI